MVPCMLCDLHASADTKWGEKPLERASERGTAGQAARACCPLNSLMRDVLYTPSLPEPTTRVPALTTQSVWPCTPPQSAASGRA